MDYARLQSLLEAATAARVACIGDVMVDRFVYGEVSRTSPEAPIAVLQRSHEQVMLGAAGNVARNVVALGGKAVIAGVIGIDDPGREALDLVGQSKIESRLVSDPDRPTTEKIRYVATGQQLLRVDTEDARPLQAEAEAGLAAALSSGAVGAGALLLSDYGKGAVTPSIIDACLVAAKASGAKLIIDTKVTDFARYGLADLIKPNASELARATGSPTSTDPEIEAALAKALAQSPCAAVLVTRAAKGMSLAIRGEPVRHFSGLAREVFDVSGAGDTVMAGLGLALASGASLDEAVELALLASSVVVGKLGTATASPDELIDAALAAHLAPAEAKVATPRRMAEKAARWREQGLKVGFTNGCFDILHKGHVAYLVQARAWCDRLIVGLNSDRSIRELKGDGRPINDLESRAIVLAGLSHVDLVTPFDDATPLALIEAARPDVLIKGADYSVEEIVGAQQVKSWGGEVRLAPLVEGYSTTAAITRILERS